jgi:hypothetical protein
MADADVASRRSPRSRAKLTQEHLCHLAALADADHEAFTRRDGRPEYCARRLAVVLAQGAALHYLDGHTGVKDLDVWTFYAGLPATRFPADKRETHADFGSSVFGCQSYDLSEARNMHELVRWRRWSAYSGRRVDFLMRALPVQADAPISAVVRALQEWLACGSRSTATHKPSAWHLARKAAVLIYPGQHRGDVVWALGHPCLTRTALSDLRPLPQPQVIPPPERVWTGHEWSLIRRGRQAQGMDERWHAFVEDQRLYLHRSWTGWGVYEAHFAPEASGWRINSAVVAGDHDSYRREGDEHESALLEAVIESVLLGVHGGPGQQRWERACHDRTG